MSTISPDSSTAAAVMNFTGAGAEGGGVDDPIMGGLRRSAWIKIGAVALLFVAVFWPNLTRIWNKVNPIYGDPNWQHGVFVPLVSLYFLYVNRDDILKTAVRPAWAGLGVLLAGLLLSAYSVWPLQNDFVWDFGMVLTLFGVVLLTCGWQVIQKTWFPIAFLVCAIPWPGLFYSEIAWPLQQLAARVAVKVMTLGGVDAGRSGTRIFFLTRNGDIRPLNVAEACAGLRSLMTFISLGAAVAFLTARPLWQRLIIVFSAIPIAIFCNVMRVSGQGLIDYYVSQQFATGFAHTFYGLVMYIPAFFLLLLVMWVLDHLFLDEADELEKARLAGAARSKLIVAAAGPKGASAASAGAPAANRVVQDAPANRRPAAAAAVTGPAAPVAAAPTAPRAPVTPPQQKTAAAAAAKPAPAPARPVPAAGAPGPKPAPRPPTTPAPSAGAAPAKPATPPAPKPSSPQARQPGGVPAAGQPPKPLPPQQPKPARPQPPQQEGPR